MSKFKLLLPTILMIIFEAAIGTLLLIDGKKFTQVVFVIFGVLLLICGVITLISTLLASRKGGTLSVSRLILSIILLAVGGFFSAASGSVLSVVSTVTLIIGIIMTFNGMLKLVDYLSFRKVSEVKWIGIIASVVTIILGIVVAFNPFGATEAIWKILGILIIVSAALDIISLITFAFALKHMPKQATVIEAEFKDVEK